MSNQEQKRKPVWRVPNYDGCVPSDLGPLVLVDKDIISSELFLRGSQWFKLDFILDVLAYQTTRTKAAKCERVECWEYLCVGGYLDVSRTVKCPRCNGKSYTLEHYQMIVHGKKIRATKVQVRSLIDCGISREGNHLAGVVFLKHKFIKACDVLDMIGLEYEFAGSFDCGVYIETKGIKEAIK